MNRSGYDVRLAAGSITAGGTLGILIPPSIMLVVMGPILNVPVTDLFAAAIVPGLMLAALYTGYTAYQMSPKSCSRSSCPRGLDTRFYEMKYGKSFLRALSHQFF